MDHNDYFCYTRTKRASKRKLNAMKFSKHLTNSQLSSKKKELQSEINELERDFTFLPNNLDENPDNNVQEIIQYRIKALDLLTSGIQELTQNYTSRFENYDASKTKHDGMSDLTMDKTESYIKKKIHKHYKTIKIGKATIRGKIQKKLIHWSSSNNVIRDTQN